MGLFDSLKKVINNADNLKSQLDNVKNKIDSASRPNVQNTVRPFQKTAPASSVIKTPACVIQSGHKSAKPSVLREHTFFDGDSEIKMTFKLSAILLSLTVMQTLKQHTGMNRTAAPILLNIT